MGFSDRYETGQLIQPASKLSLRSRSLIIFGLTVCSFTLLTLWLSLKLNLYIDELYSLHTTGRGFAYALQQALGFEQQPPLYFLALTAWRKLSASDAFARLFSIECCIVTLFVVRSFARRRLTELPDWAAPLALAFNPFFLWAALDIRVYALIILISSILLTTFFDAFIDEETSLAKFAAFTLTAVIALYTQYFIGSLFIGFGVTILLSGARKRIVPFAISMVVVALACLPLLEPVRSQFSQATVASAISPTALAVRMLRSTVAFVYPHTWISAVSKYLNVAYLAVVAYSIVVFARGVRSNPTLQKLATIVACIGAFFLILILVVAAPVEMPRHISTLFVPLILVVLASIAAISDSVVRRRTLVNFLAVVVLCSVASDIGSFRPPLTKEGDWQRVGEFLTAHVRAGEPIAVFDAEDVLAIRHYYTGTSRIVALPRAQSFAIFDRREYAIHNQRELAAVFPALAPATGRAWLVFAVSVCPIVELGASCAVLDSYQNAHFRIVEERAFAGTVVRELAAK